MENARRLLLKFLAMAFWHVFKLFWLYIPFCKVSECIYRVICLFKILYLLFFKLTVTSTGIRRRWFTTIAKIMLLYHFISSSSSFLSMHDYSLLGVQHSSHLRLLIQLDHSRRGLHLLFDIRDCQLLAL